MLRRLASRRLGALALRLFSGARQQTVLPNGITVVSDGTAAPAVAIKIGVRAGPAFETDANAGVSHMLRRAAFLGTTNWTQLGFVRAGEQMGAVFSADVEDNTLMYSASGIASDARKLVAMLGEVVASPSIPEYSMDEVRELVSNDLQRRDSVDIFSAVDAIETLAFGAGGRSTVATLGQAASLSAADLKAYRAALFTGKNMVVAGAGIEHAKLVDLVGEHLEAVPAGERAQLPKLAFHARRAVSPSAEGLSTLVVGYYLPDGSSAASRVLSSVVAGPLEPIISSHRRVGDALLSRVGQHVASGALIAGAPVAHDSLVGALLYGFGAQVAQVARASLGFGDKFAAVTEEEVKRSKAQLVALFERLFSERATATEDMVLSVFAGETQSPAERIAAIEAVSHSEVASLASSVFASQPAVVIKSNDAVLLNL